MVRRAHQHNRNRSSSDTRRSSKALAEEAGRLVDFHTHNEALAAGRGTLAVCLDSYMSVACRCVLAGKARYTVDPHPNRVNARGADMLISTERLPKGMCSPSR